MLLVSFEQIQIWLIVKADIYIVMTGFGRCRMEENSGVLNCHAWFPQRQTNASCFCISSVGHPNP